MCDKKLNELRMEYKLFNKVLYIHMDRVDEFIEKSDFSDRMFRFAKKLREADDIIMLPPTEPL